MYNKCFKEFVSRGISKYYIGIGNPNSNILIIGKESAIPADDTNGMQQYLKNADTWMQHIATSTSECMEYPVNNEHSLRKGWGKNTWSKYQKLMDCILLKESKKHYVDFLKYSFTSEINDSPSKRSAIADKSTINTRKSLLKKSDFIQRFPIVILACSNYIVNNNSIREIDTIFDVTYDGDETGKYYYNKSNWFFVHHNKARTKLVIHTRQLSADVKNDLLKDLGNVISKHANDNRIKLK